MWCVVLHPDGRRVTSLRPKRTEAEAKSLAQCMYPVEGQVYQVIEVEPREALSPGEYVDRYGMSCGACGSSRVRAVGQQLEIGYVNVDMVCDHCCSAWFDTYHLATHNPPANTRPRGDT